MNKEVLKCTPGVCLPQPFFVKEDPSGKRRFKTSEIISIIALIVSVIAVFLNAKSYDNTAKALAIADSTCKINYKKDSVSSIKYEIENRAYLQITDVSLDTSEMRKPFVVKFNVRDMGRFPARIEYTKFGLGIDTIIGIDVIEKMIDKDKGWRIDNLNEILSNTTMTGHGIVSRAFTEANTVLS